MLNPAFWWLLRSLVGSRGRVYPRSNNTCCEISCFLKTTAKLENQYIVGLPNLKVGDQSLPVPTVDAPMRVMGTVKFHVCIQLSSSTSTGM